MNDSLLEETLRRLDERHQRRHLRVIEWSEGPLASIDGRRVILLASNDYLGLSRHPSLKRAAIEATERYGVGSGASRLISGTLPPHLELEQALAEFKETERALVFGSGYLANIGLIPALARPGDMILADRLCHASLIDGCRLSGAALRVFRHNDMGQLASLLAKRSARTRALIVTEGIFSMDGDAAPLPDLAALSERYGAGLVVDDAHGTGVMGRSGRGTMEHFDLGNRIPFHMVTLGKAFGCSGAYVVGSATFIDYLLNTTRSFIYSTAPPPSIAAAARVALAVTRSEPERLARLWRNRAYFVQGLAKLGYRMSGSVSPIIPVHVGDARTAMRLSARLFDLGVFAPASRPPTVPQHTSRIRTTVTSEHTTEQLDTALAAFAEAGRQLALLA